MSEGSTRARRSSPNSRKIDARSTPPALPSALSPIVAATSTGESYLQRPRPEVARVAAGLQTGVDLEWRSPCDTTTNHVATAFSHRNGRHVRDRARNRFETGERWL